MIRKCRQYAAPLITIALLLGGAFYAGVRADAPQRLVRYLETKTAPSVSANAFTINLANGTHFQVSLTANVTSITFSNLPTAGYAANWTMALTQDGTGGRTVTGWPAAVKWAFGTAPTITATASKTDLISCLTYDGGTTDWCVVAGQNF